MSIWSECYSCYEMVRYSEIWYGKDGEHYCRLCGERKESKED